jgi:hypothetical protein
VRTEHLQDRPSPRQSELNSTRSRRDISSDVKLLKRREPQIDHVHRLPRNHLFSMLLRATRAPCRFQQSAALQRLMRTCGPGVFKDDVAQSRSCSIRSGRCSRLDRIGLIMAEGLHPKEFSFPGQLLVQRIEEPRFAMCKCWVNSSWEVALLHSNVPNLRVSRPATMERDLFSRRRVVSGAARTFQEHQDSGSLHLKPCPLLHHNVNLCR